MVDILMLLSLACGQAPMQPLVRAHSIPAETKTPVGRLVAVKCESPAKSILWRVPDGFDSRPIGDGRELLVVARPGTAPGRYPLLCVACVDESPVIAEGLLVVGDDGGPPIPPPPVPDGLRAALQKAFDEDTSPKRAENIRLLAELYKQAADLAEKPEITTAGALLSAIRRASVGLVPAGELRAVREVLAAEVARVMPTESDAALTDATRRTASGLFRRLSAALEQIGGKQ